MQPLAARPVMETRPEWKGKAGYLPYQMIVSACEMGIIHAPSKIEDAQFQPVSLDLRLGSKAYRIQSSFLPENDTVENKLKDLQQYEVDLSGPEGGILERHAIYLIPLQEELDFPDSIYGKTNPKSSTGRLDMFTRVIIDRGHRFDEIPRGYKGKMYLEVIPRTFQVRVFEGLKLNQLRLGHGQPTLMGKKSLEPDYKNNPILFDQNGFEISIKDIKVKNGLYISVDLFPREDGVVAYKAKQNSSIIDLSKINHYDPREFWEPVCPYKKNRLILEPESFYIMMSKEKICIWPHLLAEMVAYEPNSGELRTHYAGFFDPGFGWSPDQERLSQGTNAVMEVRPHDVPFMVEDGQTFCRLEFEKVIETPTKLYGKSLNSNYQSQGLTLSKYFKK